MASIESMHSSVFTSGYSPTSDCLCSAESEVPAMARTFWMAQFLRV